MKQQKIKQSFTHNIDLREEYAKTEGKKRFGTYRKPFHQWVKDYRAKNIAADSA